MEGGLPAEEKEARPTEALLLRPLLQKRADSDPAHIETDESFSCCLVLCNYYMNTAWQQMQHQNGPCCNDSDCQIVTGSANRAQFHKMSSFKQ